jgi:hypothetical protein
MPNARPSRSRGRLPSIFMLSVLFHATPGLAQTTRPDSGNRYSQADLLLRLIDLDRLTMPPRVGERAGLFSSFDRESTRVVDGKYAHWDANNDRGQFLKKTQDGWDVWADVPGPGVINRVWCDQLGGDLRVIIDGQPLLKGKLGDLFSGAFEPMGEPLTYTITPDAGGVCYYPIGFAKSCVIQTRGFNGAYQVDYTAFPPASAVAPFAANLDPESEQALARVVKALKNGLSNKALFGERRAIPWANQARLLPVGGKASAPKPKGKPDDPQPIVAIDFDRDCTVRALYAALTDRFAPREFYALHNLVLRVYAGAGRKAPDVEAPLVDFFGSGFDRNLYAGLTMGTNKVLDMPGEFVQESWFMYCYFPMPVQKGARIEIENLNAGGKPIGVMMHALTDREPPPAAALVFRARYRQENPCKSFDFPVIEAGGAGRLVGTVLAVDCPRADWWGEGDHKIWIDGENYPSIFGTGTADYFGNVAPLKPHKAALAGVTAIAPHGKNSCYRFLVADSIPFQSGLRFTLENWQLNKAQDVSYATVAYWYGQREAKIEAKPLKPADLKVPGLRIPNSVEVEEKLEVADKPAESWGSTLKEVDAGNELSSGAGATITTASPVIATIRVANAGQYKLRLRTVPGRSFDNIEVADAAGKPIGTVKWAFTTDYIFDVGVVTLAAGDNKLRITCSKKASLDCWILEPAGK